MSERFGKYELVRHLATGGMGEVFLARQLGPAGFARTVVVKRLLPHLARDQAFVEMFLNEARVASLLSHPNVAQILELGEAGGTYFIVMEFVHGASLQRVERTLASMDRVLHPGLAVRVLIQALRGLEYAHALRLEGRPAPVIHRDLSPDNLLIGFDGVTRVIDFGIARAAGTESTTRTGTVKGKFAYMPPERFEAARTREVDPRADVYAMGVVAYEALGGARPFRGSGDAELVGAILRGQPRPLDELNPSVPPALAQLVARALAQQPGERFQSAGVFADALEAWLRSADLAVTERDVATFLATLFPTDAAENPALVPYTPGPALPATSEPSTAVLAAAVAPRWGPRIAVASLVGAVALAGAWFLVQREAPPVAGVAAPPALTPEASVDAGLAVAPAPVMPGRPGRVSFRVKPWAEIWLGDEKLGVTPNVQVERPAGEYVFTLKHPDFPPRALRVQVLPDSQTTMKVDLSRPP